MLGRKIKKIKNWYQGRKNLKDFRARLTEVKQREAAYRVVLVSHELSVTGAPLMLLQAAKAILDDGGDVRVVSYMDGSLREKYEALGIPVFYHSAFRDNGKLLNEFGGDCDYAVANTVVTYSAVNLLDGPEVLWWIHEGKVIEDDYIVRFRKKKIRPDLEQTLRSAKKIAVVSDYACQIVRKYNQNAMVLPLAEEDFIPSAEVAARQKDKKVRFAMLGAVCPIKGQDLLIEAIKGLPADYLEQTAFCIAGLQTGAFYEKLRLDSRAVAEIEWLPPLLFSQLADFYQKNDVIVIASRDESFSLVALEACMFSRPLIVSSNVGAKFLVVSGKNGEIFANENVEDLRLAIMRMVDNRERLAEMGAFSRRQYEQCGTVKIFRSDFLKLLKG